MDGLDEAGRVGWSEPGLRPQSGFGVVGECADARGDDGHPIPVGVHAAEGFHRGLRYPVEPLGTRNERAGATRVFHRRHSDSVNGTREHDAPDARVLRRLEHSLRPVDVRLQQVLPRRLARDAGQVDDRVRAAERLAQRVTIENVQLDDDIIGCR